MIISFISTDKPIHANQYIRRESADMQFGYVKGHVNVTCEALAEPPATFQWFRNNKPIKQQQFINGEHVSFLPVNIYGFTIFTVLVSYV